MPALISSTLRVGQECRAGLPSDISSGDSREGSLQLRLRALIWRFKSRRRFCHFFSPYIWPLPPATSSSSSSSAGKAPIPPSFPSSFASCLHPPLLHPFLLRSKTPAVRPPMGPSHRPRRTPPPPPGESRGGPAGTRLPIPYMDKCVQAKSGIQAPDVSLQLSGHRTGDRGEGVGTVGRKEGGRHQPAAAPARPKFHFLSVGSLPGPARAFPGSK